MPIAERNITYSLRMVPLPPRSETIPAVTRGEDYGSHSSIDEAVLSDCDIIFFGLSCACRMITSVGRKRRRNHRPFEIVTFTSKRQLPALILPATCSATWSPAPRPEYLCLP